MELGLNHDYVEMLSALCVEKAEFLLVGAYAMAVYGVPRATGYMDLWIRPTRENAERVWRALERFGAPLARLTLEDLHSEGTVLQFGVVPCRIDLLTRISGVAFEEAWTKRGILTLEGLSVPVLHEDHLLQNKLATGRPKDRSDVAMLRARRKGTPSTKP